LTSHAQEVPFDIIGESYYLSTKDHQTSLSNCLNNHCSALWQTDDRSGGGFSLDQLPATPPGRTVFTASPPPQPAQVNFIRRTAKMVTKVTNLWRWCVLWGTEFQAVSGVNESGFRIRRRFLFQWKCCLWPAAVGGMSAPLLDKPRPRWLNVTCNGRERSRVRSLMTSSSVDPWPVAVGDQFDRTTGAMFTTTLQLQTVLFTGSNLISCRLLHTAIPT